MSCAFSLIEMLVVISLITLLIAMLLPSMWSSKENARATACMVNLREIGTGIQGYMDQSLSAFPYGVPKDPQVIDHPHYEGWGPGGARGYGVPPQQQLFSLNLIRDLRAWICPTDPHPQNYNWWDFTIHPDITGGSSYMFSEDALFGVAWKQRKVLKQTSFFQPSSFGYATDGWMCPNGWTWGNVDPDDVPNLANGYTTRIDWNHLKGVNVLYGDLHVARAPQRDARLNIRTHPYYNY
ncbi:MAG: type II secretion system protein [Phycisphaeraceae bacterium]